MLFVVDFSFYLFKWGVYMISYVNLTLGTCQAISNIFDIERHLPAYDKRDTACYEVHIAGEVFARSPIGHRKFKYNNKKLSIGDKNNQLPIVWRNHRYVMAHRFAKTMGVYLWFNNIPIAKRVVYVNGNMVLVAINYTQGSLPLF